MATTGHDNSELAPSQAPTITVTKRLDRSLLMLMIQTIIKPFGSKLIAVKKEAPAGSQQLEAPGRVQKKVNISERKVEDIYIYDILPKQGTPQHNGTSEKKSQKRIYYFAGGGWQMPASGEHWSLLAEMAVKLPDTKVSMVSYPLAPHNPAPVAFPQLMKLYHTVVKEAEAVGEEVILAGDSAGGNIVLALVINALTEDEEAPCPKAVLAISPSTDLRRQNSDIKALEKRDPILRIPFINESATAWRGEWQATDVRVSPLYADLTPLAKRGVKVHGVVGRYDILSPDAVLFREKCNQAWISGEWLDWERQMHCFPLMFSYKLREGVEAMDWILDVLRRT